METSGVMAKVCSALLVSNYNNEEFGGIEHNATCAECSSNKQREYAMKVSSFVLIQSYKFVYITNRNQFLRNPWKSHPKMCAYCFKPLYTCLPSLM